MQPKNAIVVCGLVTLAALLGCEKGNTGAASNPHSVA